MNMNFVASIGYGVIALYMLNQATLYHTQPSWFAIAACFAWLSSYSGYIVENLSNKILVFLAGVICLITTLIAIGIALSALFGMLS